MGLARKCKQSHTGFWEYVIAIHFKNKGKNSFTINDVASKIRELENCCLIHPVKETTIVEQLTCRCCAQGSLEFDSLLNYFNREEVGLYSLFDPKADTPIQERVDKPCIPTQRIVEHISRWHKEELNCVLNYLGINDDKIVYLAPTKSIKEHRGFTKDVIGVTNIEK